MITTYYCACCGGPIMDESKLCTKCSKRTTIPNKVVNAKAVDDWRYDIEERLKILEKSVYFPKEGITVIRPLTHTDDLARRVNALESLIRTLIQERNKQ